MKYLELDCLAGVAGDLGRIEELIPGISLRLEVYSLKKTREQKKISRSGKYTSYSAMIAEALNLTFFGYELAVHSQELRSVDEESAKSVLVSKLFTLGITKSYTEMVQWVDRVFVVIRESVGEESAILRVEKRTGPFEKCFWSECLAFYGKDMKRLLIFVVLYGNQAIHSPVL
ncbi:hypothetical protein NEHOM01_2077 [Nematocida homosporus]|uniref:uncharacterized protein n=1 Tax=Nematocida homosporus TaxID=1912981 RepID=UPI00221FDBAF|nr:uncharacterized protein NEHOM01_2077 [Nematocida homosporus]KAI5187299.1 hypothetical protein NEHOM01_2077 [Nematocida homosporus]